MISIQVSPFGDGWRLRADAIDNDMVFQTGGRAEAAGRALGQKLAASGQGAKLEIFLRDGAMAGAFVYPPSGPFATAAA